MRMMAVGVNFEPQYRDAVSRPVSGVSSLDVSLFRRLQGRRRLLLAGRFVVMAGDDARSLLLLDSGSVAILVQEVPGHGTLLIHQFRGGLFGERYRRPKFTRRSVRDLACDHVEVPGPML